MSAVVSGAGGSRESAGGDGRGESGSEGEVGEDWGGVSQGGGGGEARSSWSAQAEAADMSSRADVLLGPDAEQKRERFKEPYSLKEQYSARRQRCEKFFGEQMDVWQGGGGRRADTFERDDALSRLLVCASGLAMHQVLL